MNQNIDLNQLILNLIHQKRYSHCRLCLKYINNDNFVKFVDCVAYDQYELVNLSNVLVKLFGNKINEDIAGIDAICPDCVDDVIKSFKFIEKCENSTQILGSVLDNVNSMLDTNIVIYEERALVLECNQDKPRLLQIKPNLLQETTQKINYSHSNYIISNINKLSEDNLQQPNKITCTKYGYATKDNEELSEHSQSNVLQCNKSSVNKCTKASLINHEQSDAKTEENHYKNQNKERNKNVKVCPNCSKKYATTDFYLKHVKLCLEGKVDPHPMRSKIVRSYFCQECGKGYSTPGGLRVHHRFAHGNAKPHVCDHCGKKFTAPSYLRAHLVTHSGQRNFPCDICPRKFVSKEALLYHTRRHTGEKPYPCNLCNEKFVNASARADHIKHKHIGPTMTCNLCSKKFVTKNYLKHHMIKHYDPTNKLYIGRKKISPDVPGEENMRVRIL